MNHGVHVVDLNRLLSRNAALLTSSENLKSQNQTLAKLVEGYEKALAWIVKNKHEGRLVVPLAEARAMKPQGLAELFEKGDAVFEWREPCVDCGCPKINKVLGKLTCDACGREQ